MAAGFRKPSSPRSCSRRIHIPIVGVMGNHDRRTMRRRHFLSILDQAGVRMLDGETWEFLGSVSQEFRGPAADSGRTSRKIRFRIAPGRRWRCGRGGKQPGWTRRSLNLGPRRKLALLHFAPTTSTLVGEPPIKYWLLGNSALGHVVEKHQVDLVLHGHSHIGSPFGLTPGGVPVFNVAAGVTGGCLDSYDSTRSD